MPTVTTRHQMFAALGGETLRVDIERTILSMNIKLDKVFNIPENSTGIVTLWDAAVDPLIAWSYGVIIVDPGNVKPTLALPLRISQTISAPGTTVIYATEVTRELPLTIANRGCRLDLTEVLAANTNFSATGLTKIQARNVAAANGNANDVQARIVLVGA